MYPKISNIDTLYVKYTKYFKYLKCIKVFKHIKLIKYKNILSFKYIKNKKIFCLNQIDGIYANHIKYTNMFCMCFKFT